MKIPRAFGIVGKSSARASLAVLAVIFLTACNPFDAARPMMDEYVERLGRVLETDPQFSVLAPAPILPRRRERVLDMPELELGMLDFLSLYGCDLQFVVGEKNSIMGKVMQPLNRLRYELRFITSAGKCLQSSIDDGDEKLQNTLRQAISSKRENLPIALWNATWGVEEVENLFTTSKGFYPVIAENPLSDLAREAAQLERAARSLLSGELEQNLDFAGAVQQRWQAEYHAGQLINSALLVAARLNDGTAVIKRRLAQRPLCLNGNPNNQSTIVQGMFFSIYIGKVQPYLADLRRGRIELLEPLAQLAQIQTAVMPQSFQRWQALALPADAGVASVNAGNAGVENANVWDNLDKAVADHTRGWQKLLEQCGLRPGA
ncbi:DUF3080 domain-containing protein [Marinobacter psychrophilus]|uniref:DUF3080 domain-containing protein n=1 Tax=Marinobacter psychrophilus TaxID=330734 RepID=UPI001B4ADD02|nr:DUF3080 domain-containing protein [Marinobacter psychrophilus]MBQ0761597.1 DUF3080 domain-containing protein [Marinobacter psychrophilus]